MSDLSRLREEYARAGIDEAALPDDPVTALRSWLDAAIDAGVPDPTAMVLATVDAAGDPATRTVLCKGLDERGLAFYTNLDSDKALHLAARPRASALFLWRALQRQAIVAGDVEDVDDAEADAYFASRPRHHQLGAWASPQSREVAGRDELEERWAAAAERFGDGPVPRPPRWGGLRIVPERVELWQGRVGRLHDRVRYVRSGDGWSRRWIAP